MKRFFILFGAVVALSACTIPAIPANMVPKPGTLPSFAANSPYRNNVTIESVGGGAAGNEFAKSAIDEVSFRKTLDLTLKQQGLLAADAASARFRVAAFIIRVELPKSGYTMASDSFIRYILKMRGRLSPLFDEIIPAKFSAGLNEAFLGFKRQQIVMEGAIRANIAKFIWRLRSQSVPPTPPTGGGGASLGSGAPSS